MKTYLLIFLAILLLQPVFGQNPVPNAGFENWTNFGTSEEPDGWATLNSFFSMFGAQPQVTKSTDARTGNFAISLRSDTLTGGMYMPGLAVGSFAITERPLSVEGFLKYAPANNDMAIAGILVSRWNSVTQKRDTISDGYLLFGAATDYTNFTVSVLYTSAGQPDSAHFYLFSGTDSNSLGSELIVDDVVVYYNPLTAAPETKASEELQIFPNPSQGAATMVLPENISSGITLSITDALGRKVQTRSYNAGDIQNNSISLKVNELPRGMYVVHVQTGTEKLSTRLLITR